MNLLSHAYLGWQADNPAFTVNFLWDYLGRDLRSDNRDFILQGRDLHARIDQYADQADETIAAKKLMSAKYRRLGGIIIDVAYDHFLLKHWQRFSTQPFEEFIDVMFKRIVENGSMINPKAADIAIQLAKFNWYDDYKTVAGLENAFRRIGRRCSKPELFAGAEQQVIANYNELEQLFLPFYEQACRLFRSGQLSSNIAPYL